jgi:hypothetical protein
MTESIEAVQKQSDRWRWLAIFAAPTLVLLAIVLPFLRFHEYDLLLPESLILIAGAVALGIATGAVTMLRPATLRPALMALALCLFALYRQEIIGRIIPTAQAVAEVTGNVSVVLGLMGAAIFLAIFACCYVLRQHINTVVATVFGTFVLSALFLPTPTGGEPTTSGALPADLKDLPPVIHIILDEHIGLAGLPYDIEGSGAAARAIRSTYEDFALYRRAYSSFGETQYSLSDLMNDEPGRDVTSLIYLNNATYVMRQNEWFDRLKGRGYAIKVYQSSWLDMCTESTAVDACYTYPLHSINAVQRTSLPTLTRLSILLGKLQIGPNVPLPAPLAGREALVRFQSDFERAPRGVAYIVHLMLPHYGFLYNADCSLADPAAWENQPGRDGVGAEVAAAERRHAYRLYFDQAVCTGHLMTKLFERLKRLGVYDEAIVIVHGDHGSRIAERTIRAPADAITERDLLDHYSTLLALRQPDVTPGVREVPTDLQALFAETFLDGRATPAALNLVWMRDQATNGFRSHTLRWPGLDSKLDAELISARRPLRPSID